MKYLVVAVRLNELTTKQVSVPAWEFPVLEAIYGDAAQVVDQEVVTDRPVPNARDEFARLANKYDRQIEVDNATVSRVYGTHQKGIAELAKAIKEADTDEQSDDAKDRKSSRLKALKERQKAEAKALEDKQKAELETAEEEFDQREADRKARIEADERERDQEAARLADLNARTLAKLQPTHSGRSTSGSAAATRAGGETSPSLSVSQALPNSGVSRGVAGGTGSGAPGDGPSGTGASPGTKTPAAAKK